MMNTTAKARIPTFPGLLFSLACSAGAATGPGRVGGGVGSGRCAVAINRLLVPAENLVRGWALLYGGIVTAVLKPMKNVFRLWADYRPLKFREINQREISAGR